MHWLICYSLLLATFKLSYQSRCPYSDMQSSASNSINRGVIYQAVPNNLGGNNDFNVLKPVPETGLTVQEIDTLLQNYFNQNSIKRKSSSSFGDQSFNFEFDEAMKLDCAVPPLSCGNDSNNYIYRNYDGSCNNILHPGYGMAKSRYSRLSLPKYGDGKNAPSRSLRGPALPNPRVLSLALYGDDTQMDNYRTLITMQWGQIVGHDISQLSTGGAPEDCCTNPNNNRCYSIQLHPYGPITMTTGKTCLSFARALSDADVACPRSNSDYVEKISLNTPYLDLSSLYGNSLEENIKLREHVGGLLKTIGSQGKQFLPVVQCPEKNDQQCYSMPDQRNQVLPTIAAIHTIFAREHNRLATVLGQLNPQFSDEQIFQLARKINVAQYQKITYYDWLPLVLGPIFSYSQRLIYNSGLYDYANDYDESWEPSPLAEFSAAAFRYSHNQIPGWFSLVSANRFQNQTMRLSEYIESPKTLSLMQNNLDALIRGLITQLQKRSDGSIDRELKHHFNRKPFDEFGTDLKAIDIQRGRDFGLASYNDYRQICGLSRAYDWSGFADLISVEKISLLQKFYASPDDVDLSVGGSLEIHSPEALFGPTFQCILAKQFLKARKSDRFFFEHEDLTTGFTRAQLAEIRKVSLAGILCANTENLKCVQPNVFVFPNTNNGLVNCNSIPQLNVRLWRAPNSGY